MPLVTIYPLPSSLPQPSLGCSRPSAHPPPGRISGRGQGLAEHCWSGLGLKLFPPSPEVQLACPQAQGQLPCLTTHTTEPKPSTALPTLTSSPPAILERISPPCLPQGPFSSGVSLPGAKWTPRSAGTAKHGSHVPRCCSPLPFLGEQHRLRRC